MKRLICLFVYGTLMTGERNAHKLPSDAVRKKAVLKGFRIDDSGSAPRMFYDDKSTISGELVTCKMSKWELFKLDLFEWKYTRTKVFVNKTACWAYVAKP